jgi:ribosome-binding ATPase YchF (GTP1/OBG family)
MKLSIGIVGLPNVGKSALFKALTNEIAQFIEKFPIF